MNEEIEDIYNVFYLRGIESVFREKRNKYLALCALTYAASVTLACLTQMPSIKDDLIKKILLYSGSGVGFVSSCSLAISAGRSNLIRKRAKRQIIEITKE